MSSFWARFGLTKPEVVPCFCPRSGHALQPWQDCDGGGPTVFPLFTSPPAASDCPQSSTQGVAAGLIQELMANPAGFYVNVHTADFPDGAIRGQLAYPLP